MGDLVATCSSPLSRNRTFGEHLGRGETLEQAQAATRQTAEGVKSCLAIRDLARAHGVEMPITEQVERVCHEGDRPAGRRGRPDEPRPPSPSRTSEDPMSELGDGTRCVHAGLPEPAPGQPFLPGPVFAAPYHLDPVAGPSRAPNGYGRTDNPTRRLLEAAIGELEGGDCRGLRHRAGGHHRRCCSPLLRAGRHRGAARRRLLPGPGVRRPTRWRRIGVRVLLVPTAGPYPSFDGRPAGAAGDAGQPGPGRVSTSRRWPRAAHAAGALRRGGQHHRHPARAAPAGPRRRPGGRLRHQGADRPLRPAAGLRGAPGPPSCSTR